jgi:hypothetical protein
MNAKQERPTAGRTPRETPARTRRASETSSATAPVLRESQRENLRQLGGLMAMILAIAVLFWFLSRPSS